MIADSNESSNNHLPEHDQVLASELSPLAAMLVSKLQSAWKSGIQISVEELLANNQATDAGPEVVISLVYEELCLREELGETVDKAKFSLRFPHLKRQFEMLFECYDLLKFPTEKIDFPVAGETIGEFQLVKELGRGAAGRVFLATQPALSDRPVVLKVTTRSGVEHLSLARLQHTGIVPIYLTQDLPQQSLRLICMPYLGGQTLRQILASVGKQPIGQRSGNDILKSLDAAATDFDSGKNSPSRQFLAHASYVQAVSWIGACLADALHFAHERGLLHLDVKPSNILVTSDGQPMLLDFHLAADTTDTAADIVDQMGGTKGYMAPERMELVNRAGEWRAECLSDRRSCSAEFWPPFSVTTIRPKYQPRHRHSLTPHIRAQSG